jgi:predicted DNA-binding ribbon-helix-helix protein
MDNYPTHIRKRSVRLAGHQTSVSIEDAFWDHLIRIAREQDQSINSLITQLDADRTGNLSSAIRIYVLDQVTDTKPLSHSFKQPF